MNKIKEKVVHALEDGDRLRIHIIREIGWCSYS